MQRCVSVENPSIFLSFLSLSDLTGASAESIHSLCLFLPPAPVPASLLFIFPPNSHQLSASPLFATEKPVVSTSCTCTFIFDWTILYFLLPLPRSLLPQTQQLFSPALSPFDSCVFISARVNSPPPLPASSLSFPPPRSICLHLPMPLPLFFFASTPALSFHLSPSPACLARRRHLLFFIFLVLFPCDRMKASICLWLWFFLGLFCLFCSHLLVIVFSHSLILLLLSPSVPPAAFLHLVLRRWAEVVIGRSTISMQSHGAVALPSLIEPGAKYRHSRGSASLPGWKEGWMSGWRDTHTHIALRQCGKEQDKYWIEMIN